MDIDSKKRYTDNSAFFNDKYFYQILFQTLIKPQKQTSRMSLVVGISATDYVFQQFLIFEVLGNDIVTKRCHFKESNVNPG